MEIFYFYLALIELVLVYFPHVVVVVVIVGPDEVDCGGHHHQRGDLLSKLSIGNSKLV